jgi:hypothetical protein
MKTLFKLFFQLGFAAVAVGLLSYVLPFFGLKFKNAGYLDEPGAKILTILVGIALIVLAYIIGLIDQKRKN